MTLLARTTARRARQNQHRAETRMDEIVSVSAIGDDYALVDRQGDLAIEARFQELYNLVDSDAEKHAVAAAYAVFQKAEAAEDRTVRRSVDESVEMLKEHNDLWLGAVVTPDMDGAA